MKSDKLFSPSPEIDYLHSKEPYIPFLGGRPYRLEGISKDDILNLKIDLHRCSSLTEFLENMDKGARPQNEKA